MNSNSASNCMVVFFWPSLLKHSQLANHAVVCMYTWNEVSLCVMGLFLHEHAKDFGIAWLSNKLEVGT